VIGAARVGESGGTPGTVRGTTGERRYAISVNAETRTVVAGTDADLLTDRLDVSGAGAGWSWTDEPVPAGTAVSAQVSAHGAPHAAVLEADGSLRWLNSENRVAPGQTIAIYDGDRVLGSAIAA